MADWTLRMRAMRRAHAQSAPPPLLALAAMMAAAQRRGVHIAIRISAPQAPASEEPCAPEPQTPAPSDADPARPASVSALRRPPASKRAPRIFSLAASVHAQLPRRNPLTHAEFARPPPANCASVVGEWLSPDPIAEDGGLNLYAYAQNSPTRLIDVLGLSPDDGCSQEDDCGNGDTPTYGPWIVNDWVRGLVGEGWEVISAGPWKFSHIRREFGMKPFKGGHACLLYTSPSPRD